MNECKKCGECCRRKVLITDTGVKINLWECPYLNADNSCKIYSQRSFMKPKWCYTIEELKQQNKLNTLPKNCSYYQGG